MRCPVLFGELYFEAPHVWMLYYPKKTSAQAVAASSVVVAAVGAAASSVKHNTAAQGAEAFSFLPSSSQHATISRVCIHEGHANIQ